MKKRCLKGLLCGLLVLCLLCGMGTFPVSGAEKVWVNPFLDVPADAWFRSAAAYMNYNRYIVGMDEHTFYPGGTATRAMFVTILGRMCGVNAEEYRGTSPFSDPAPDYAEPYIAWAQANCVVSGTGDNRFSPDLPISREQVAAILYNYMVSQAGGVRPEVPELTGFSDLSQASGYAVPALAWAVDAGIMHGYPEGTILPRNTATRAEIAQLLMAFARHRGEDVTVEIQDPEWSPEDRLLLTMSLEEKVEQMFLVRCPANAAAEVRKHQFGGLVLFGRDFSGLTAAQVREKIGSCQNAARVPLLIAVDEEGGTVVRVSSNSKLRSTPFASPRDLYASGGMSNVLETEQEKIDLLSGLGINVNLAPVCDVSLNSSDFMYARSLGQSPEITADYAAREATLYQQNGMGCVLKHFPGYGDNRDTHMGMVTDPRPLEIFRTRDLLPFAGGIDGGAGGVLVSHNIVACLDSGKPASLSPAWHRLLREELGFTGCIITDDLSMGAIQAYCDSGSAAVQAVIAGNDLLCCTDYPVQLSAVLQAVKSGQITEARIDESVRRILHWKAELGLLD